MPTDGTGRAPGYWDTYQKAEKKKAKDKDPTVPPNRRGSGSGDGVTAKQKRAANNLVETAKFNKASVTDQLTDTIGNFDLSDEQNARLAAVEKQQNSMAAADDRFAQLQKLQSSAAGIMSSAGNALEGSQLGALSGMLSNRNNQDTTETLSTLRQNQNAVQNSLDETINANVLARNDARSTAHKSVRDLEADTAAQLNTMNPKLFSKPGTKRSNLKSKAVGAKKTPAHRAALAGYITPGPDGRY